MSKVKGSTVVFIRDYIRAGHGSEEALLSKLTQSERQTYESALAISWIDIGTVTRLNEVGAKTIFPNDADGLRKLGALRATHHLKGMYKVFLRVMSVKFVINQTAKMWRTYHDTGEASVSPGETDNERILTVRNYPNLTRSFRQIVAGYIVGGLGVAGAKNVQVKLVDTDPGSWKWKVSWTNR